jgi:hypothetical protein
LVGRQGAGQSREMLDLPKRAWRTVRWREGATDWLSSRFARLRGGVGQNQLDPGPLLREWLLIEWPEGEPEPIKYCLSTLPPTISFRRLVDLTKMRWRIGIGRDYQVLKQEVGLGHYEGRGWRGSSSRLTVHCGVWLRNRRAGDDSPLRISFLHAAPDACFIQGLPSQRILPLRPERHIPNSIATMRACIWSVR